MSIQALKELVRYLVSFAVLVVAWGAAVRLLQIPAFLLPDPAVVGSTLVSEYASLFDAAAFTVQNMMIGGIAGVGLGLITGFLLGYSRTVRWIIEPYLTVFQSFPRESLFPLLIVWLGFGALPKIVNAALLSYFPVAVVTMAALLDTRDDYVRLMQAWKASRFQEFLYCRLPAATPSIVGAIKVAFPLALIGAVIGEFLGSNEGLGYIIISSGSAFRVDRIFAAIVLLALIGVLTVGALTALQRTYLSRFYQS